MFNKDSMNQEISAGRIPNVRASRIRSANSHVVRTLIRSISPPNRTCAENPCARGLLGNAVSNNTCEGVRARGLGMERRSTLIQLHRGLSLFHSEPWSWDSPSELFWIEARHLSLGISAWITYGNGTTSWSRLLLPLVWLKGQQAPNL